MELYKKPKYIGFYYRETEISTRFVLDLIYPKYMFSIDRTYRDNDVYDECGIAKLEIEDEKVLKDEYTLTIQRYFVYDSKFDLFKNIELMREDKIKRISPEKIKKTLYIK